MSASTAGPTRGTFPQRATGPAGWSLVEMGVERATTEAEAKSAASRWTPASSLLIRAPGANHLLPPICIPVLQRNALWSTRKASRNGLVAVVAFTIMIALGALTGVAPSAGLLSLTSLLLLYSIALDHFVGIRSIAEVQRRALFLYAARMPRKGRPPLWLWLGIIAFAGACQLLVVWTSGSREAPFELYGFIYEKVAAGEWWRVLSGPLLHFSPIHFALNSALLVLAAPLASHLLGRSSIPAFFLIAQASGLLQWRLGPHDLGAFGGLSGGVYGLLGLTVGTFLGNSFAVPWSIALLIANTAIVGIAASALLSTTAANVAHCSGALLGVLCGYFLSGRSACTNLPR